MRRLILRPGWAVLLTAALAAAAQADINGFGNFSNFRVNQADGGSAPGIFNNRIRLTSTSTTQSRSIFCLDRQDITSFTASFTYELDNAGNGNGLWGGCFVLQNDPDGPSALGSFNAYGYTRIAPSIGASLEISNPYRHGLYTDGDTDGGADDMSPVNLRLSNPINVTLTYDGSLLTTRIRDTVTNDSFEATRLIDIPAAVGGPLAYVGFTASTSLGTNFTGDQYFSDPQFHTVPEPSSALALTSLILLGLIRQLR
ncbi:MAG: hypothetical protein JNG88_17565 [Phycisphaerales bacterium]|nr:hypothetical protein [Phycisphaerales bacterium]